MARNLKILGLTLVATFAFSAIIASGASAFTTFTAVGAEDTTLSASGIGSGQVFSTGESKTTCTEISFDNATMAAESATEITAEPTYGGTCTITIGSLGTLTAKIDTNGCHYLFTASGFVHIKCPEGKQIEITAKILGTFRKCIDIHQQTPATAVVDYTNTGTVGQMDVEIESTVSGITYEKTANCAFGDLEDNDSAYSGKVTLTGSHEGSFVGMTVS